MLQDVLIYFLFIHAFFLRQMSPSPFALHCDATVVALTRLVTSGHDAWAGIWDMLTKVQGEECTVGDCKMGACKDVGEECEGA